MSDPAFYVIRVATVREPGAPFTLEDARLRAPRGDEVLVRLVATGLCRTDLAARDQQLPIPLPAVLGHEGAGIVEAAGPGVHTLSVGDHVVLSFGYCGQCGHCCNEHPAWCDHFMAMNFSGRDRHGERALEDAEGQPLHGHFFAQSAFATHVITEERTAIRVPQQAPLELLGPLACGVLTGAGAVFNVLRPRAGERFATLGAGNVGLSAVMAARIAGAATIIAVDERPERLELALSLGATHAIDSRTADPVEAIRNISGGIDHALEATGDVDTLSRGINALDRLGTLGVAGTPLPGSRADFDVNDLLLSGKRLVGILEGDSVPEQLIPELVRLYMAGELPFDRLHRYYDLADINQAAEDCASGGVIKPVLRIDRRVY